MANRTPLGEKLRRLRRSADITQDEAAQHADISARALAEWEKGGMYQLRTLSKLLDLYEATPEQRADVLAAAAKAE